MTDNLLGDDQTGQRQPTQLEGSRDPLWTRLVWSGSKTVVLGKPGAWSAALPPVLPLEPVSVSSPLGAAAQRGVGSWLVEFC